MQLDFSDMDTLKKQILDVAVDNLSEMDDRYVAGWIDGVLYTCEIFAEIMERTRMMRALASMPLDGKMN